MNAEDDAGICFVIADIATGEELSDTRIQILDSEGVVMK